MKTAAIEKVAAVAAKAISRFLPWPCHGIRTFFHMTVSIFKNDDRIINDHSHHHREAKHGHVIPCETHEMHDTKLVIKEVGWQWR